MSPFIMLLNLVYQQHIAVRMPITAGESPVGKELAVANLSLIQSSEEYDDNDFAT